MSEWTTDGRTADDVDQEIVFYHEHGAAHPVETGSNYHMIRTPDGFVGYWDGDLLAGKGLSTDVPRSKGLTFDSAEEALMWAERINAETGLSPEVVDRNGAVVTLAETDGFFGHTDGCFKNGCTH